MFDSLRRFVGAVQVKQTDTNIIVSGIPADVMAKDISRIWGTSKLAANMFTMVSKNALIFPKFFAPDVVYAIDIILKDRSKRVSARTLTHIKEKLLEETWLLNTQVPPTRKRLDRSMLKEMVLTPLEFQERLFDTYDTILDQYSLNGYLFAGAPGSGKTYASLAISAMLHADLVVVIAPKQAAELPWEVSVNSLFHNPPKYWMSQSGLMVKGDEKFLIGHYESMDMVRDAMMTRKRQLGRDAKVMVILDESHHMNEMNSMRTVKFIELAHASGSEDILWLSGTPIKAFGYESIPIFRCFDPLFTKEVEEAFRKIFGKDAKKGLDILQHRLGIASFKVGSDELGLQEAEIEVLPVKIPNGHKYTLSAIADDMANYVTERRLYYKKTEEHDAKRFYSYLKHFEETHLRTKEEKTAYATYRQFLDRVIAAHSRGDLRAVKDEMIFTNQYEKNIIRPTLARDDKEDFRHLKTLVKYVSLKIQGEALGRVLGRKRIECHLDMVEHVDYIAICDSTTKKTLIFTSFVEVLQAGAEYCKKIGLKPVVVYGETNKNLSSILKDYTDNEETNPLWATFNSLSTAVPLVMADNIVMMNAPFRAYIDEQAIARTRRLDATTQTHVTRVMLDTGNEPNLSTRSAEILKWSQDQVEAIMGIKAPFEITGTEALESFTEGPLLTISCEDYDIVENVTMESLVDLMPKSDKNRPAYARW